MLVSNKENYTNGFLLLVFSREKKIDLFQNDDRHEMMLLMEKSKDQHAILCVTLRSRINVHAR